MAPSKVLLNAVFGIETAPDATEAPGSQLLMPAGLMATTHLVQLRDCWILEARTFGFVPTELRFTSEAISALVRPTS